MKPNIFRRFTCFKGNIHKISKRGTFKVAVLLICIAGLGLTLGLNVLAQETKRLGLNTTLRTLGEEIKYIQELDANRIRVPLQWQLLKIRPGEYDWRTIDRLLKTTQEKKIEILFNLRTLFKEEPQKLKSQRGATKIKPSPVDKKEWLHFVEAVANRYRGQGVNYEIENEVNREALWKGTLEDYLEILEAGYDVIKRVDPKAKVLPSAMECGITQKVQLEGGRREAWKWHDKWLQPILSTKKFDVVNVHNYYFPSDIMANGLTFRSYLSHIHELIKKSGMGDRPLWITEIGYVSGPKETAGRMDNGSYEKQAQWLKEAYQQTVEFNVERIYWLLLRDRNEPYFGSMGLADAKGNPRPAWDVFYQLK